MHLTDDLLNEYLDAALAAEERARAEQHLALCPECAARLDAMRTLFSTLEALPAIPLTRDVVGEVLARLAPPAPILRPAFNWVFALQGLVALVLLALAAPFVVGNLAPAELTALSLPVTQFTMDLLAGLQAQWQSLISTFTLVGAQSLVGARALTAPLTEAPIMLLGAVAAGLVLLWLLGNGVLLRSTLTSRSR